MKILNRIFLAHNNINLVYLRNKDKLFSQKINFNLKSDYNY